MPTYETELTIDAPPAAVWKHLIDVARHDEWSQQGLAHGSHFCILEELDGGIRTSDLMLPKHRGDAGPNSDGPRDSVFRPLGALQDILSRAAAAVLPISATDWVAAVSGPPPFRRPAPPRTASNA